MFLVLGANLFAWFQIGMFTINRKSFGTVSFVRIYVQNFQSNLILSSKRHVWQIDCILEYFKNIIFRIGINLRCFSHGTAKLQTIIIIQECILVT